jgi:hypothetical protein
LGAAPKRVARLTFFAQARQQKKIPPAA